MHAPTRYHQIVDLTFSDDSDEEEAAVHDTTTTTTLFTSANTTPATVSSVLKILSNRNGVSYAFDGSFGSKEATTAEGRAMLRKEYGVHERLKKSYLGATDLKDLPVVLALAWSNTGILQRGPLGGFIMRHVDSG
jgi:predicted transcriptional regulator